MTKVLISEDELYRLREKAGEIVKRDGSYCRQHGHTLKLIGGTNAGCCRDCCCSVEVHECTVCGYCDCGETDENDEQIARCEDRVEMLSDIAITTAFEDFEVAA